MQLSFTQKKHIRKNFGKLVEGLSIPNLIEVQKNSYNEFLESKSLNEQLNDLSKGIDKVFKSIFPIEDGNDKSTLEYISYKLEKPKFDVIECKQRSLSYSASLKANLRLVVYEIDTENNTKQILSAKEQEVFIGELPLMTPSATFITNGVERVVVNQMHRSPGVFFDHDKGKTHASGKLLFNCRIIPGRGSWLDFEFDPKDILYFRIDRKRKLPITTFLFALGFSKQKIIETFYSINQYTYISETKSWTTDFNLENYKFVYVHKLIEDGKIAIRNIRRDGIQDLHKVESDGHTSSDIIKDNEAQIQNLTDNKISRLNAIQEEKEKELLEV